MRPIIACLAMLMLCSMAGGGEFVKPLKEARTREELLSHFGNTVGFGSVDRAEFRTAGRELLALWYCPFSGRAACYLHAYYHDQTKDTWIVFIDRLIDHTATLSAEMSEREQALIFRDGEGKVVLKESVAALPAQVWLERNERPCGAALMLLNNIQD